MEMEEMVKKFEEMEKRIVELEREMKIVVKNQKEKHELKGLADAMKARGIRQ